MKTLTRYEKLRLDNMKLGSLAKKTALKIKKPTPLENIMRNIKLRALGNRFIVNHTEHVYHNGLKVKEKTVKKFYLKKLISYTGNLLCDGLKPENILQLSSAFINSKMLCDIVMEQIDKKFNRNNPTKFRGMDCIN